MTQEDTEQKPETQEDTISQLIDMVDNDFEIKLRKIYFSRNTKFDYYLPFITLAFNLVLFMSAVILFAQVAQAFPVVLQQPASTQIAVAISLTAALIALSSFAVNLQKAIKPLNPNEMLFDYNYRVLKEKVAKLNLALLKGLVNIKSKHPELSLKDVIELPITKDKLFDMLYK